MQDAGAAEEEQSRRIGFYTVHRFWAATPASFSAPRTSGWFANQMEEIVYQQDEQGVALTIARDGAIELRVHNLEGPEGLAEGGGETIYETWTRYLLFANAFSLVLNNASMQIDNAVLSPTKEITPDDCYRRNAHGVGSQGAGTIMGRFQERYVGSYINEDPENAFTIITRRVLTSSAIQKGFDDFYTALQVKQGLEALADLNKAASQITNGNYGTGLLLSWLIYEREVNLLWASWLEQLQKTAVDGSVRLNKERRKFLDNDTSVATKTHVLELTEQIALSELVEADQIRKLRNKITHGVEAQIGQDDASRALNLAARATGR